jgi:hypothetical protein
MSLLFLEWKEDRGNTTRHSKASMTRVETVGEPIPLVSVVIIPPPFVSGVWSVWYFDLGLAISKPIFFSKTLEHAKFMTDLHLIDSGMDLRHPFMLENNIAC